MAQPVTAILAHQGVLADKARRFTQDANEASLLVGKVVGRAFSDVAPDADDEAIVLAMQRELDRLIARMRPANG